MHGDNPAGRLLAVIEKVKGNPKNTLARVAWMDALDVKNNDLPQLLVKMGALMALPAQAVEQLAEMYPRQYAARAHQQFYSSVTGALSRLDFSGTIEGFNTRVDDNAVNYLNALADLLEAKRESKPLTKDETSDLQRRVSELMEFVRAQDISPELKQYLLEKLTRTMEAIDSYFIKGSMPIVDSIESALGHAAFNEEYRNSLKSNNWKAFTSGLATIANIATIASGVAGLTEGTIKFLEDMAS